MAPKKKKIKSTATAKKSTKSATPKQASTKQAAGKGDIIQLILEDHKPLKKLIQIMKNSGKSLEERREAFEQFAPLLNQHAKPEEQVLYVHMKDNEELREEGFEGEVEHQLADQMVEEAQRCEDEDQFSARIKVLAELVEHHIKEEESEILPDYRKQSNAAERAQLAVEYLAAEANVNRDGSEKNPGLKPTQMSMQN